MGLFSRTLSRLDEMKKVLGRDPGSHQFLALADEHRRQGHVREAIEVLEQGLSRNAGSVAGHVALGRLLQQTGQLEGALASFGAALKLDPQNLVAIRQTADVHMSRGDKVEAIKKLKLFRGLNPGDREVNELIKLLDAELAAAGAPRPPVRSQTVAPPPPVPEIRTGSGALPRPVAPPASPPAGLAMPPSLSDAFRTGPALQVVAGPEMAPAEQTSEAQPFDAEMTPAADDRPFAEELVLPDFAARAPLVEESPVPAPEGPFRQEPEVVPERAPEAAPESPVHEAGAAAVPIPVVPAVPGATETLAELLRAQGHLGEAREAYREAARAEPDRERADRLLGIADEISAARDTTPRGRLEAWVEPFSPGRGTRKADLSATVEDVVARLGPCAALVTDIEGVPVVSAGPRAEAEAMEALAAELTAFWKNVRRSRTEIGEGALDSLVLRGSNGSAAVKAITPTYALILKAGPGVPAGRIRFEAARAAEQLRPALV